MTHKSLDSARAPVIHVRFRDCEAGWIRLDLGYGSEEISINLSHFFEPLPALLTWLESIASGVEQCMFEIEEEGTTVMFRATSLHGGDVRFRVERLYGVASLECSLPARQLVATIYQAFVDFSESPEYKRQEWETYSLADAVREEDGLSVDQWIESTIHLSRRELQKAIWRFDRQMFVDDEMARKSSLV